MSKRISNKKGIRSHRVKPARSYVRLGWRKALREKILAERRMEQKAAEDVLS